MIVALGLSDCTCNNVESVQDNCNGSREPEKCTVEIPGKVIRGIAPILQPDPEPNVT